MILGAAIPEPLRSGSVHHLAVVGEQRPGRPFVGEVDVQRALFREHVLTEGEDVPRVEQARVTGHGRRQVRVSGTLAEIEQGVDAAEGDESREAAAETVRPAEAANAVTLPSALRWPRRRLVAVHTGLVATVTLVPVLLGVRSDAQRGARASRADRGPGPRRLTLRRPLPGVRGLKREASKKDVAGGTVSDASNHDEVLPIQCDSGCRRGLAAKREGRQNNSRCRIDLEQDGLLGRTRAETSDSVEPRRQSNDPG